jgi:hypothetical protein
MDVIPPGNNSNRENLPQPTPPPPPVQTPQPSINTTPTVISAETTKPVNYFIPGVLIAIVFLSLASIIIIKIYQPNLISWPQYSVLIDPSPLPGSTSQTSTPSAQIATIDSDSKEAFENAKKVMNLVDLNSPYLFKSSLYYVYRGRVTAIKKQADGLLQITTDRTLPGLPSTWTYNKRTNTFALGDDDVMKKSDPGQITEGANIQVNGSYIISTKFDSETPDAFNLDNVMLLPGSRTLTTILSPLTSAIPSLSSTTDVTSFPIENPITKKAFANSKEIINQIDLRTLESDSGLLYIYEGKLSKVDQLPDGSVEITTDSQVAGLPKTWKLDNSSLIFQSPTQDRIPKSDLKVGNIVRIATVFIIQTNWEEVYKQDQFVLSSVSRQN